MVDPSFLVVLCLLSGRCAILVSLVQSPSPSARVGVSLDGSSGMEALRASDVDDPSGRKTTCGYPKNTQCTVYQYLHLP